ncbi:hypothetical protein PIB30_065870 [Stylosanthes scabra]|uniref:Uncharacterized protein n=1 Tax=Stylosanthes scabra TaxID=79078 RepID=A0ABU6SNN9_9FABA|nr:hypothetical protein [Stylosanthes scabra]
MEQYRYLLRGYEDTLYRLDAINQIAGRIAHMDPKVIRTQRNIMERPNNRKTIEFLVLVHGYVWIARVNHLSNVVDELRDRDSVRGPLGKQRLKLHDFEEIRVLGTWQQIESLTTTPTLTNPSSLLDASTLIFNEEVGGLTQFSTFVAPGRIEQASEASRNCAAKNSSCLFLVVSATPINDFQMSLKS